MINEKRRLHQKRIHKLMHKLGGRHSKAWFEQRVKIDHKVRKDIAIVKVAKIIKQQKVRQVEGLKNAVTDAMRAK